MAHELDPAAMTDSEVLERYRSIEAERRSMFRDVQLAEADLLSHRSSDSLARLKEARAALLKAPRSDPYDIEIRRRLNSPLKSARIARGLSQGEAAKRAGWTRAYLKDIEAGQHWANKQMCIRMWKALGLELPEGWETLE
jgi:ribosome-binding protein aMBF1 (putative translation factor)